MKTSLRKLPNSKAIRKMTSLRSGVKLKEMINCIKHRLKNLFSISDKAGRLDYFCVQLITWGYFLGAMLLHIETGIFIFIISVPLTLVLCLAIVVINLIQRLNDLQMNRWSFLILFIPIIGLIFSFYLLFVKGKKSISLK